MPEERPTSMFVKQWNEHKFLLIGVTVVIALNTFFANLNGPTHGAVFPALLGAAVAAGFFFVAMAVTPLIAFGSLHAAWKAQKTVRKAVRREMRVRALKSDPDSTYGLPGFPDAGPGSGDLSSSSGGGLSDPSSSS